MAGKDVGACGPSRLADDGGLLESAPADSPGHTGETDPWIGRADDADDDACPAVPDQ